MGSSFRIEQTSCSGCGLARERLGRACRLCRCFLPPTLSQPASSIWARVVLAADVRPSTSENSKYTDRQAQRNSGIGNAIVQISISNLSRRRH